MRTRLGAIVLVAILLAGCGGGGAAGLSDGELREAFESQLEGGPLDAEGITCVIDYIFENTTRDELNLMADAARPEDLTKPQLDIVTDAVVSCS